MQAESRYFLAWGEGGAEVGFSCVDVVADKEEVYRESRGYGAGVVERL